jgi:hypothetical protein
MNDAHSGFFIPVGRFLPRRAKNDRHKKKSTMLPQAGNALEKREIDFTPRAAAQITNRTPCPRRVCMKLKPPLASRRRARTRAR